MSENPFKLPHNVEELKHLSNLERSYAASRREKERNLKIWERKNARHDDKHRLTFNSSHPMSKQLNLITMGGTRIDMYNQLMKGMKAKEGAGKNESVRKLIAAKREIFFIQMSINTKQQEIEKMEENMREKEEELRKREEILEDDAIRFDAFLKENDKKAHDMIQQAEKESKIKNDITQDFKRTNKQLQVVRADIDRLQSDIDDCYRYKSFIDALTPIEWFEEQQKLKEARQRERRRKRIQNRKEQWKLQVHKSLEGKRIAANKYPEDIQHRWKERLNNSCNYRSNGQHKNEEFLIEQDLDLTEPSFEEEPLTSSDEELPIFFKEPQQLLNKCSSLEEENIFLEKNKQEAEQNFDTLHRELENTKNRLKQRNDEYHRSIDNIKISLEKEQEKMKAMKSTMQNDEPSSCNKLQDIYILREKIKEVFIRCNLGDPGENPNAVALLANIEACFENTVDRLKQYPAGDVLNAEKVKGKRRREKKRAEQQALLAKAQEERNRKSIERSLQAPKKRTGKPVSLLFITSSYSDEH